METSDVGANENNAGIYAVINKWNDQVLCIIALHVRLQLLRFFIALSYEAASYLLA